MMKGLGFQHTVFNVKVIFNPQTSTNFKIGMKTNKCVEQENKIARKVRKPKFDY